MTERSRSDSQAGTRVDYGSGLRQYGELWMPEGRPTLASGRYPVVVAVHGGFWRNPFRLDLMDPMAEVLVGDGLAVWNIEYRSVGDPGGGYPGTLHDVATAFDRLVDLAEEHSLDLGRVVVVGHSAGGHLALWLAGRDRLDHGWPGSAPQLMPLAVVAQAPVVDLAAAFVSGMGSNAVAEFMGGGPTELPEEYATATPVLNAAISAIVHGTDDDRVPLDHVLAAVEPSGTPVTIVDGADHFEVITPGTAAFGEVRRLVELAVRS